MKSIYNRRIFSLMSHQSFQTRVKYNQFSLGSYRNFRADLLRVEVCLKRDLQHLLVEVRGLDLLATQRSLDGFHRGVLLARQAFAVHDTFLPHKMTLSVKSHFCFYSLGISHVICSTITSHVCISPVAHKFPLGLTLIFATLFLSSVKSRLTEDVIEM